VLFSGLAVGHFGVEISPPVLEFAREFGLILFVYTIGVQVGPGFFASLRREGLPANAMAAAIVLLGAGITLLITRLADVPMAVAVGLFSGATTNTPSLGAAQEAIRSLPGAGAEAAVLPGLGYAVAYPFGIFGIILSMLLLRAVFRVNLAKETEELLARSGKQPRKLEHSSILVTNENFDGKRIADLPGLAAAGVVISRIRHGDDVALATANHEIATGDVILAVGPRRGLADLALILGRASDVDLRQSQSGLVIRRVIVTRKAVLGKSLAELTFLANEEVRVTRVTRAEVELSASGHQRLQFGDMLLIVGREGAIERVAEALGNSVKQLNHTELIPIFVGIALGVLLGSIPVAFPGVPAPVKLGLAGGPLVVAIVLSRIGRIGPLLWAMPNNANFALREIGIVLFLACVGLHSGEKFLDTLLHGDGLWWMAMAVAITLVPLLVVGVFARVVMRTNYVSLCGLLAGSMTDPPALAFANTVTGSDAPSISYATVYPLTMLLRVVCAQLLVLIFW
jgi:putative transport protein